MLTTIVVTTGSVTLEALVDGYRRLSGDFVADGFVVGQELGTTGFTENPATVIKSVSALDIKVRQTLTAEASGGARTLTVGIPSLRAWENRKVDTDHNLWNIAEDYIPGPREQNTIGPLGWIDEYPIYITKLRGPSGKGSKALYRAADAVLASFPPRDALILADSTVLRVRSIPGPERGQVMQDEDGFAVIIVTIPIWARTQNTI